MTTNIETYSKKFENVNHEVRAHWHMGREAARNVAVKLNELVEILHKEHPDWSINKIAHAIWSANEDLEGFTTRTIYNNLNDDNKALLDPSKQNRQQQSIPKNVPEESVETFQHNVEEESSTTGSKTKTLPTAYDIIDADVEPEEEEKIVDPWIEHVAKTATKFNDLPVIRQLEIENGELKKNFTAEYIFEIKNQELPLIITANAETKSIIKVELDKKMAKKLGVS